MKESEGEEIHLPDLDASGPKKGVAGLPGSKPAILDAISKSEAFLFSAKVRASEGKIRSSEEKVRVEDGKSRPIQIARGQFRPGIDTLTTIEGPIAAATRKSLESEVFSTGSSSSSSFSPSTSTSNEWEVHIFHLNESLEWITAIPENASRIVVHEGSLTTIQNYGPRVESVIAGGGGAAGMVLRYGLETAPKSRAGHVVFLEGDQLKHGIAASTLDTLIQGEFAAPKDEWLSADLKPDGGKLNLSEAYELLLGRRWPPSNKIRGRDLSLPLCFSVSRKRMVSHAESFYRRALLTTREPSLSKLFGCLVPSIYGGGDESVEDDRHPFLALL